MKQLSRFFLRGKVAGLCLALFLGLGAASAQAQQREVKGLVVDKSGEPVIGATVVVKDSKGSGTVTDFDGVFKIKVPGNRSVLKISFVGMESQEVKVGKNENLRVVLSEDEALLDEVVVVGYGQQKKASVVGAITQTTGEVLERAAGVTSVGAALTGNLPGVVTFSSSGMPGEEDPRIVIRTQSSWNNSDPLVLVDGIEREMSTVDVSSVESISVLKDASATAVYGVKGANGVILITTKRGHEGKAVVRAKVNMTLKTASKLPSKFDSYDALMVRNRAIEHELGISPSGWASYTPMEVIDKYRHPANSDEWDRYPNVDWEDVLFRNSAFSYNPSVSVQGGTKLAKYFAAVDFTHEGDLFKSFENKRNYRSGYSFNRVNIRSNLDFQLTKTTKFSLNLFGSNGQREYPFGGDNNGTFWKSVYASSPDAMRPVYSDGTWGYYPRGEFDTPNSMYKLAIGGKEKKTTTKLNTDFILQQDLDFITKGLSFKGGLSFDYRFQETGRGINDGNEAQLKWIDPDTGEVFYKQTANTGTQLDFSEQIRWNTSGGSLSTGSTYRKMYYSLQLNYDRTFNKVHNVTAMGLFSHEKTTLGSEFAHYREDWVFRLTYNYAMRYFTEFNGAYNGSEKFGPNNRFDFFPSVSAGWMVTEENFMKSLKWLDMLKIRASWGRIGDDNVGQRWLYQNQWNYGGNTQMGNPPSNTPYTYYRMSSIGNSDISWETVEKRNLGIDFGFLGGILKGSVDIFRDSRKDILVSGGSRAIPTWFGVDAPYANLGETKSHGYELELRVSIPFKNNDMRLWGNFNMTHAINEIVFRDDAQLLPAYQKQQGYAIGQNRSYLSEGNLRSWDDLYGSAQFSNYNEAKLPGDYYIVDFNGDGVIDKYDVAPYQYSGIPQNTYNATIGFDWKGFSCFLQFYGVNNVTREVTFPTFQHNTSVVYDEGTYWNNKADGLPLPRWTTMTDGSAIGTRYIYDGSYIRLKNAEVSYTFTGNWLKKMGVNRLRIYLNGNNLWLWTKMPDDRENNFSGGSSGGAYPTMRRYNLGVDLTL